MSDNLLKHQLQLVIDFVNDALDRGPLFNRLHPLMWNCPHWRPEFEGLQFTDCASCIRQAEMKAANEAITIEFEAQRTAAIESLRELNVPYSGRFRYWLQREDWDKIREAWPAFQENLDKFLRKFKSPNEPQQNPEATGGKSVRDRMAFNDTTQTVSLDGTPFKVPLRSYEFLRTLWEVFPERLATKEISVRTRMFNGKNAANEAKKEMPKLLLDLIDTNSHGHTLDLRPRDK